MPASLTVEPAPRWWVLGFDARESPQRSTGGWTLQRKRSFLYRLDVANPLSVDTTVWPAVFEREPDRLAAWTGRVHGLWGDLARLHDRVRELSEEIEACSLIAVAVDRASCTERADEILEGYLRGVTPEGQPGPCPEPHEIARPCTPDSDWEWLGCDVADFIGVSGLSNAGFLPDIEDVAVLRQEWGARLNQHHLFDNLSDARAFQTFADQRVSEHSPFFVIGLWRIGEVVYLEH